MIVDWIEIADFRGIRTGRVEGLRPLTVLTGHNGCGKSAVIEALLVLCSPHPGEALGRIVEHRPTTLGGADGVIRSGADKARLVGKVREFPLGPRELWLQRVGPASRSNDSEFLILDVNDKEGRLYGRCTFALDNGYRAGIKEQRHPTRPVKLIDTGLAVPLTQQHRDVYNLGARDEILAMVRDVLPDVTSIDALEDAPGKLQLYLDRKPRPTPVAVAGDGVQAFVQLAMELVIVRGGLALIEEPESFQHPLALHHSAKAIVAAVRRDTQVVLTTHSQELVENLVEELGDRVDDLALINLALDDGELRRSVSVGETARYGVQVLGKDAR